MATSAFKKLYTDLINGDGNTKCIESQMKQMLKVHVKESSPHFLVSDSHFFVPAYFTANAVAEFRAKFPNVAVEQLAGKVCVLSKWSLEMRKVDSNQVWTSYAGLEVRLIVHQFKPEMSGSVSLPRHPSNLYRDDEFKTTIQAFRFRTAQKAAAASNPSMAPMKSSGAVTQGISACAADAWSFKSGTTKSVSMRASAKAKPATPAAAKATGAKVAKKSVAKVGAKKSVGKFSTGKISKAKKSVKKIAKGTPSKMSTAAKKAKSTTDHVTMDVYKKMLKKGAKK
jgi:hypothetical protein